MTAWVLTRSARRCNEVVVTCRAYRRYRRDPGAGARWWNGESRDPGYGSERAYRDLERELDPRPRRAGSQLAGAQRGRRAAAAGDQGQGRAVPVAAVRGSRLRGDLPRAEPVERGGDRLPGGHHRCAARIRRPANLGGSGGGRGSRDRGDLCRGAAVERVRTERPHTGGPAL